MSFFDDIMSGIGDVGEAMQAPRRLLWKDILGLPESGSEVLSQKFGMNPESFVTKGLGFGLETLGDPLTYILPGATAAATKLSPRLSGVGRAAAKFLPEEAGHFDVSKVENLLGALRGQTRFAPTRESAIALGNLPEYAEITRQLPMSQRMALRQWLGGEYGGPGRGGSLYKELNDYLRGGSRELSQFSRPYLEDISSAIKSSPLPQNTMLYRGVDSLPSLSGDVSSFGKLVGKEFRTPGFSATSPWANSDVLPRFPIQMDIMAPKGMPAANITPLMGSLDEYPNLLPEFLLPHNSRFRLEDIQPGSGRNAINILLQYLGS